MIPHVETLARLDPEPLAGKEHGGGVGLAHRQGIGADRHPAAGQRRQGGQERLGEKARLVGDYAPGQLLLIEPLDEIQHPLIGAGADAEVGRVMVEQGGAKARGPQLFQQFLPQARPEQPEGSVGGGLADDGLGQRGKAFAYQHMVDGGTQIRGRVEQGAVEIEQHAAQGRLVGAHQIDSGRTKATM